MKTNAKLFGRRAICTVGLIASLTSPGVAQDTKYPVVPLHSFFSHWDHHWYVGLRGDAEYEAVEIMTRYRGPDVPTRLDILHGARASKATGALHQRSADCLAEALALSSNRRINVRAGWWIAKRSGELHERWRPACIDSHRT